MSSREMFRLRHLLYLVCALLVALAIVTTTACDDDSGTTPADMANTTGADMAMTGGTMDMGCFMNPTTHVQIINACTTAQSYDKTPYYPAAAPNGVLPPLP